MPEGPEIRRAADRIAAVLEGRQLESVVFDREAFPRLARRQQELVGARVLSLDTRGKALLTRLDNDLSIYSHNQLYGRWYVRARDNLPQTNRSLRLALHTASHSALLYSASEIDLLDADGEAQHPFLRKLGPDLLDRALSWQQLRDRLADERFHRRSLAALYLDQGFLAGVGNYLRSEILFQAGLDPWARPAALDRRQLGQLAKASLQIGQRAYADRGVCNPPRLVTRLRRAYRNSELILGADRGEHEAVRFAVFDRDGLPCHACATTVERAEVGSRRLYYCPQCQGTGGVDD